jgi:[DsrC]-trisulfide reductase subunit M
VVDDFDLSGPSAAVPQAAPPLTDISVAYALFTYFAFTFLAIGLALQTWRLLRQLRQAPPEMGSGSIAMRLFRAGTDVLLLRTTFFADRWAWIFGAAFHFGLLLILLRHLRYFLDPSWVGPLWKLVELEQPFGFYGGLALPLGAAAWWLRQIALKQGRIVTGRIVTGRIVTGRIVTGRIVIDWADHAVMALLIAIPVVGYANTIAHTDVVAVKAYAVGLVLFHWQNIPTDPLLLIHLWLVAVLMVLLPFSRLLLLLPFGNLLHLSSLPAAGGDKTRVKLLRALGPALVVVMLAPVAVVARHAITQGFHLPVTDLASLVADHKTDDATVMIRNHPRFLFSHRTIVMHTGVGSPADSLERCVTCHEVKDASGQPVGFDDPSHFCRGCHTKAAVSIDCFECHQSRPSPEGQATLQSRKWFAAVIPHIKAPRTVAPSTVAPDPETRSAAR